MVLVMSSFYYNKFVLLVLGAVSLLVISCTSFESDHARQDDQQDDILTFSPYNEDYTKEMRKAIKNEYRAREEDEFEDLLERFAQGVKDGKAPELIGFPKINELESFADRKITGYWDRLGASFDGSKGYLKSVRTKASVYHEASNSIFVLSMKGEVFWGRLLPENGLRERNRSVLIYPRSFVGIDMDNGRYRLIGGVKEWLKSESLYYSDDGALTWKKADGGDFDQGMVLGAHVVEDNIILVAVIDQEKLVIKKSSDLGKSYQSILTLNDSQFTMKHILGCFRSAKIYNTLDTCVFMVPDGQSFLIYQYKNGEITFQKNYDFPKPIKKGFLYGTVSDEKFYLYMDSAQGKGIHLTQFDENFSVVDQNLSPKVGPLGNVVPTDGRYIIERWTNLQKSKDLGRSWEGIGGGAGWDGHATQFFQLDSGKWLMINNTDNGVKYAQLDGVPGPESSWIGQDYLHYYAELHGGDVHENGVIVACYQDQGCLTYQKKEDGDGYHATLLQRPDGLSALVDKSGKGVWHRYYWPSIYYSEVDETGKPIALASGGEPHGKNWQMVDLADAQIENEVSVYSSHMDQIIKYTFDGDKTPKITNELLAHKFPRKLHSVGVAKGKPDLMHAVTHMGEVYFSKDRGVTWTQSRGIPEFGNWSARVRVADDDPDIVYVSLSNYQRSQNFLYLSTNGGRSYKEVNRDMPANINLNDISVCPSGEYVFGSNYHVYVRSENRWYPMFGQGFFKAAANAKAVRYEPSQKSIYYFTTSAGVVRFRIDQIKR